MADTDKDLDQKSPAAKGKKKSSKKSAKVEAAPAESSNGQSWRDFITSASAALDDLGREAEATVEPSDEAADGIKWNTETRNLEIIEDQGETASQFEELAKRVAESVAERKDLFEVPASELSEDVVETAPANTETPDAMSDDSGEARETIEAEKIGVEPETTFDLEAQDEAATEGDLVAEDSAEVTVEAASEGDSNLAVDFEMADTATFEEGAQQLELGGEAEAETESVEAAESASEDEEPSEEPTEFVDQDTLVSVIESLLFSTDKPVSISTMKQIFKGSNIRTKDIQLALETISVQLAAPHRGVTLEEVGSGFQLRTKSDNAEYLRRLAKVRPFRLSGPALETMAIVAYKQPVTKHEIDEIRGVESGHLLRALMERGLVAFAGKSDLPGKPMNYTTTRKFLETFGLRNLKELPTLSEIDEILPEGIGETEEKETLSDLTDRMSTEIGSTYSEGEDELEKINEQLLKVDTTSEFFEQEKQRERDRRDRERAQDIRERLVVGEAVEAKDQRWLDRYEAKLLAGPASPTDATDETVEVSQAPEANTPVEPALSEQLETLTTEEQIEASNSEAHDEDGEDWSADSSEDLIEAGEWDEDDGESTV